jgi:predicted Fe-Mo cluster-binding NifX family protein
MIAIPVDSTNFGIKSSTLFGNAPTFALYNSKEKTFIFKKNTGCGNGIETAKTLQSWDVNSVVYSFLGDGPFKTMNQNGIDIYYIGKEPIGLIEIINGLHENAFIKVDAGNADTYLDPGTNTGNCDCGCSHE